MKTKTKIEPVFHRSLNRWLVDIPASIAADGKRYKARFKTRDAAREYIASLTNEDDPASAIPPITALEADKARSLLEPYNRDLVQAARELTEALDALGGVGTLLEAATAFHAEHARRNASRIMRDAVNDFLDGPRCGHLRPATAKSYDFTLRRTLAPLASKVLAEVSTEDFMNILSPLGATSQAMHRRNLRVFWKWACSPPRSWGQMAVVDAVETPRRKTDGDITCLSSDEVRALLTAAASIHPHAAVVYAMAVFAGIRRKELTRLTWGHVHEDHIEISGADAKKASRRIIPICPTLRAWIDSYKGDVDPAQPITPKNWGEIDDSCRRLAGWEVVARNLTNPPEPTRGPWPQNVLRHTNASLLVATGTSLTELIFSFGHRGDTGMLHAHYVKRMTKKTALEILAVMPPGAPAAKLLTVATA